MTKRISPRKVVARRSMPFERKRAESAVASVTCVGHTEKRAGAEKERSAEAVTDSKNHSRKMQDNAVADSAQQESDAEPLEEGRFRRFLGARKRTALAICTSDTSNGSSEGAVNESRRDSASAAELEAILDAAYAQN